MINIPTLFIVSEDLLFRRLFNSVIVGTLHPFGHGSYCDLGFSSVPEFQYLSFIGVIQS
jgi:hypothetical protein